MRGIPKKNWGEVIRHDMIQFHLFEDMIWRLRIRVEKVSR